MLIDYRKIINKILKRAEYNRYMFIHNDKKHLKKLTEWEDNESI